ncbi:phosphate signaling complex protein PhoU [Aurantimicrobium minutum]|uniref:Phosphate-specific transport system accessory protein PhoU n=1 Tax=Aurantimicrobium minutum TaxID=708131 RepID=A0A173LYX7_9MICO|nr:phosphate signaling complex protein PhoU [Aurantimicrobium minutum]MDH6238766.1 phosphate transport system protein [Aurantimicrobium minutum]BAV00068.1 phosphate transport system protein [Aurantimicrobium minutum]
MRDVFQQELQEVQQRLVEIAELVAEAMRKATTAFQDSDITLAEEVIEEDAHIDELALTLDELAIQILARQQPVARDLRVVVSALRMSANLERMGDMAEHLAQLTRYRFPDKVIAKGLRTTFKEMGEIDIQIAEKLIKMLKSQELKQLEKIRDLDDKIDSLHLSVFDKVLSDTWAGTSMDTVDATLASRYYERFSDHAISIARKVAYLSTGEWAPDIDEITESKA